MLVSNCLRQEDEGSLLETFPASDSSYCIKARAICQTGKRIVLLLTVVKILVFLWAGGKLKSLLPITIPLTKQQLAHRWKIRAPITASAA